MGRTTHSLSGVRFQDIRELARKGHRDWVFYTDKAGVNQARRYCADAIKEAIYAVGTAGRWFVIGSNGSSHVIRSFRLGNIMLRNAKRGLL